MERAAIPEVRKSAEESFAAGFYCAESVVVAIAKAEGVDSELLPRVATGFGGGTARTCGDCGALTGAILAVGSALGRSAATESVEPTFAATGAWSKISSASLARVTAKLCSAAVTSARLKIKHVQRTEAPSAGSPLHWWGRRNCCARHRRKPGLTCQTKL